MPSREIESPDSFWCGTNSSNSFVIARADIFDLILADRSGSLLARVWEGASELTDSFNQGDIVKAQGDVETYLDRPQMIIAKLRVAKEDEYDLRDFQPSDGEEH